MAHALAGYLTAKERHGRHMVVRDGAAGKEFHTGWGEFSTDRDSAVTYSRDAARTMAASLPATRIELA